jgi:hypothetical protein
VQWLVDSWPNVPVDEIPAELGISRATAYRTYNRATATR